MLIGTVLAAGNSTRLPNKALLPIYGNAPCIFNAIEFLQRQKVDEVIVVVKPHSLIEPIVKSCFSVSTAYQSEATGVIEAVPTDIYDSHQIVVFCDNVYDLNERVEISKGIHASVRYVNNPQLDFWDEHFKSWQPRSQRDNCYDTNPAFAGWITGPTEAFKKKLPVINWLNSVNARPAWRTEPWADIGTMESYHAYWKLVGTSGT